MNFNGEPILLLKKSLGEAQRTSPKLKALLLATLCASLAQVLAMLLLCHALAALLDYGAHR